VVRRRSEHLEVRRVRPERDQLRLNGALRDPRERVRHGLGLLGGSGLEQAHRTVLCGVDLPRLAKTPLAVQLPATGQLVPVGGRVLR